MSGRSSHLISSARIAPSISLPVVAILVVCAVPMLFIEPRWIGVSTFVLLLLTAVGVLFSRVKIDVDDTGVHARSMGIFHMNFQWAEITSVAEGPKTGILEGAGYRYLPGGAIGLLVGGPTITICDARRRHLLSVDDPGRVAALIQEQLRTSRHTGG